ncbi:hypothetical protein ZWY2020_056571 [Hordeum vulgare]|nr:hypothetical protein ZWY2020_056571 [Hordeum vulgare]
MPSETCCSLLREAVKNGRACLCALYASPEIFKAFNINVTDALRLSKRCGITETSAAAPAPLRRTLLQVQVLLHQVARRGHRTVSANRGADEPVPGPVVCTGIRNRRFGMLDMFFCQLILR